MKRCPECAEQIQDEAKVCRFCGHDFRWWKRGDSQSRPSGCSVGCGVLLLIGIIAVVFGAISGGSNGDNRSDGELVAAITKRNAIEGQVKQVLRDPESATFEHLPNACGYVNSRNGFGGMSGRQRFLIVYSQKVTTVWLEEMDRAKFERLWRKQCA